jgi:hypothetical protein
MAKASSSSKPVVGMALRRRPTWPAEPMIEPMREFVDAFQAGLEKAFEGKPKVKGRLKHPGRIRIVVRSRITEPAQELQD